MGEAQGGAGLGAPSWDSLYPTAHPCSLHLGDPKNHSRPWETGVLSPISALSGAHGLPVRTQRPHVQPGGDGRQTAEEGLREGSRSCCWHSGGSPLWGEGRGESTGQ